MARKNAGGVFVNTSSGRAHWASAAASSAGSCHFSSSCGTSASTRFGRPTALGPFPIHQARALLDGNIDVPAGSLGIEEFVVRDRSYMYFPPFPVLLRLPVLLVTDSLDGDLTVLSMLVGWMVFAVATARLIWIVRRTVRGEYRRRVEAAMAAIIVATITVARQCSISHRNRSCSMRSMCGAWR